MMGVLREPRPTRGMSSEEGAGYWFMRHRTGGMSTGDHDAFEVWLDENPANRVNFEKAGEVWKIFDGDEDASLAALRGSALAAGPEPKRGLWIGLGTVLAASLVAAVALTSNPLSSGLRTAATGDHAVVASSANGPDDYATRRGERRRVRLPDGTFVTLNTDTEMRLVFSSGRRTVRLIRGQALFEVAHDAAHPFVVEAADRQVTALGTIFEVRLDPGRMQVTLVQGKVVVDHLTGNADPQRAPVIPAVLTPGQEFVAELGAKQQISNVDVGSQLRWRDGFVEFNDEPLGDAVSEINRYTDRPIVIPDDRIAGLKVSGVFRTGDPLRFAGIVGELLPVKARTDSPDRIELVSSHP
ncbi:MAG: Anti-FecI sigma factor FecR [Bradyrhizobium sp.]|nr:Anti-FecI sigma factor FecR [Bradyrhizobium sp.]